MVLSKKLFIVLMDSLTKRNMKFDSTAYLHFKDLDFH